MIPTVQSVAHTKKSPRVSFDPMMHDHTKKNSTIQSSNNNVCLASPPSTKPLISILQSRKIIPTTASTLDHQLIGLRDSNTLKEAQAAILALLPTVRQWTFDLKESISDSQNSQNSNATQHSSISLSGKDTTSKSFHQVYGVSILVLALKEWEDCPLVVATNLRILAFLVAQQQGIGQTLVHMGGLRTISRVISKHHFSKNEQAVTACVALLAILAQYMPSMVESDACLALVVHGLWRFPNNSVLQGFGCLFLERVLRSSSSRLLLWGASYSGSNGSKSGGLNVKKNEDSSSSSSNSEFKDGTKVDTWSMTTIHQKDTLEKVVLPLLIRIKKYHSGSNPTLCQRAQLLFQFIEQNMKIGSVR